MKTWQKILCIIIFILGLCSIVYLNDTWHYHRYTIQGKTPGEIINRENTEKTGFQQLKKDIETIKGRLDKLERR